MTKRIKNKLFIIVLFLLLNPLLALAEQLINLNITSTTPTGRFVDNSNETITDTVTGLMWKKCPEGLSGAVCGYGTSVQTFLWQEALLRAQSINQSGGFAGYTDWRVPNIKELASIVEERNYDPAINLSVFPMTPSGRFWSSTSFNSSNHACLVDFIDGGDDYGYKNISKYYVRMVRSIK